MTRPKGIRNKRRQRKPLASDSDNRFFEQLSSEGIELSEKARQAIEYAIDDARTQSYDQIYEDSLFAGLVRIQGFASHLLESSNVNIHNFMDAMRKPLPNHSIRSPLRLVRDYRVSRGRRVYYPRDLLSMGEGFDFDPLRVVAGERQEITTADLLLRTIEMPVVWHHLSGLMSVNKVRRHIATLGLLEPDIELQKFALFHDGKRLRISAFEFLDAVETPSREERKDSSLIIVRQQLLFPGLSAFDEEIEQLEWLLNRPSLSEYEIQRFFEEHPDFLLGVEHKKLYSQVVMTNEDGSELRPDFFLERVDGGLSDILDLKLPTARLVVGGKNRRTFSSSVMSVMGQLSAYRNYFNDARNRNEFYKRHGFQAYKPMIFAVIGRSKDFRDPMEREDLQQELSQMKLLTYDDLLLRAKRRRELLLSTYR